MGITGLLPLLKSIQRPCSLGKFRGQTLGVDAYGWLHRGTVACAVDLALGKPTTKFVDSAMHRVRMLLHFGVKPYIVFDGDYLPSKAGTEADRSKRRQESRRIGLELLKLGKTSQAYLELQKAVDVTPEMARLLIEELKHAKVDYIVAPYEADSQLAYLERKGVIDGIISEDSDMLVFGAKCLITKLDQYGDCVVIKRSEFTACREVSFVGWSDAEFRRMAILSGCDYLQNINKIGLKTAHRLIRKHKHVERIIRAVQYEGQFKVPPGYLEAFYQAEQTFLYQWVFCPLSNAVVNVTEPPTGLSVQDLKFLGPQLSPEVARRVARGDLHPNTKQPIVIDARSWRPAKSLAGPSRIQALETPDLKKAQSIDSFFKPRRTPLAELDPNSFTPSPSQQRLLQDDAVSWPARMAPGESRVNMLRPSATFSAPSQPSRRAVSDPVPRKATMVPPTKRQRLCSEDTPNTSDALARVESSTSRFFGPSAVEPSPSVRKSRAGRRTGQVDLNLWSDDSLEEAMAELPDPSESSIRRQKAKVSVFKDPAESALQVRSTEEEETSQSTVILTTFSKGSQDTAPTATPISSCFSRDDGIEYPAIHSSSDLGSTIKVQDLRSKFSYKRTELRSARHSPASTQPRPPPRTADKSPDLSRATLHDLTSRSATSWRDTMQRMSDRHRKLRKDSLADSPPPTATTRSPADAATTESRTTKAADTPSHDNSDNANDDSVSPIEDSAWHQAESKIVVPGSDGPEPSDLLTPRKLARGAGYPFQGSEDFLVPDSEDDGCDSPERPRRTLDFAKFVFAP